MAYDLATYGWRAFAYLAGTHRDIEDRAQALGQKPRLLADGNVQVGDVVIAA